MDPKNLSQLDPNLREAYERVMGVSSPSAPQQQPQAEPALPSSPVNEPTPQQPQPLSQEPSQPSPIEPVPTVSPAPMAPAASSPELASPSVFGVDVPPPPPPPMEQQPDPVMSAPMQASPMDVPPPPPPPPSVAQNDPTLSTNSQTSTSSSVQGAKTPNKLTPILVVVASVVFLLVWGFFWTQLLLK